MQLIYSPVLCKVTGYTQEFVDYLTKFYSHFLEEEEYKGYIQINKQIVITKNYMFIEQNNNIFFYSGMLAKIIKDFNFKISSSIAKYKCTDQQPCNILYEHQNKIVKYALQKNRGVIKSPTGSGKSFVISDLINRYIKDGLKVLVTVPTIDLQTQLANDIKTYFSLIGESEPEIGYIGDGKLDIKNIVIGIPQSLAKIERTKSYLNTVDVLIADEVHTCTNPTYSVVIQQLYNAKVTLGLSATPAGGHASFLDAFFGPLIVEIEESEMIKKDIIMEPIFEYYSAPKAYIPGHLSKPAGQISSLSNAYRYKVLNEVYDIVICNNKKRNELITKVTIDRINEDIGPVIVIVKKIKGEGCHGDILRSMFLEQGIDLPIIAGHVSKKKREKLLDDLKESKISGVIAGPRVLSAGISIPSLSTIVLATAGRSDSEFIQRVGRLLRKQKGKLRPKVIDFWDSQYWFDSQSAHRMNTAEEIYGIKNIRRIS